MIENRLKAQRAEIFSTMNERARGQNEALAILHQFPTVDDLHQEAKLAEKNKQYKEASVFNLLAEAPGFIENDKQMSDLQYSEQSSGQQLKKRHQIRDKLFLFNEATKEYLNQHPNDSMEYVTSFANASYQIDARQNGITPTGGSVDRFNMTARGMRAELAFESILGRFTDNVSFDYDQVDDPETRRRLDAKGVDYILDVTVLGHTFQIGVDIKANFNKTIDDDGYAIPGKLWCQCDDSDFINNSTKLNPRALYPKLDLMRRALLVQIQCQYPDQLEELSAEHRILVHDIPIA